VTSNESDELQGRGGEGNFTSLWFESAGSSIFELFGTDPTEEVREFRAERPIAGFTSQLAGSAIPYAGWFRATKAINPLRNALTLGKETVKRRPLLAAAAREPLRFAPLEAGRVASSAFVDGGDNFQETVASAGINLAAGGALGFAGGLIGQAGKRAFTIDDITTRNSPAALTGRRLEREIEFGNVDPAAVEGMRQHVESLVLNETVVTGRAARGGKRAYIDSIRGLKEDSVWGRFNALFNEEVSGKGKGYTSRMFSGMADEALERNMRQAGIKRSDLFSVQFPRLVQTKSAKGKKSLEDLLKGRGKQQGMTWIDDQTGYLQEESGLWMVAKKTDDGYVVFKTDKAELVSPSASLTSDLVKGQMAFWHPHVKADEKIGAEMFDGLLDLRANMDDLALDMVANAPETAVMKMLSKSELAKKSWFTLKKYFAPADLKITDPLARKVWGISQVASDTALERSNRIINGGYAATSTGKNPINELANMKPMEGYKGLKPMRPLVEKLNDGDLKQLNELLYKPELQQRLPEWVREGWVSKELGEVVDQLTKYDEVLWKEMKAIAKAEGVDIPDAMKGHLMLSRTWTGDNRVPVYANIRGNNQVVWLASGQTTKQAQDEALAVVKALRQGDDAIEATVGQGYQSSTKQHLSKLMEPGRSDVGELIQLNNPYMDKAIEASMNFRKAGRPQFLQQRRGMPGAKGDYLPGQSRDSAPWSQKDVLEILTGHVNRQQEFVAQLSATRATRGMMQRLADQGKTEELILLKESVDRMFGRQGEIAQLQNQISDSVLGGVMGKNSANKMAAGINKLMFQYTLGLGNPVYPALNMLTFTQTVVPHIAFLQRASGRDLGKYYSMLSVADTQKRVRGGLGVLSSEKITWQGFRRMGNPDARDTKLWHKAVNDGTLQPVLVDEAVGPESIFRKRLQDTLKSGNAIERIEALSEWAPRYSEQFARGHAFATALEVGENIFKISDDERLYQFAREFVTKTMFRYGPGDRASVITGPIGSSFGLFKNWMMHQMGWMMAYGGVGARDLAQGKGAAGFAPLAMLAAGTGSIGGTAAMPGSFAMDWISRLDDDQTFQQHLYNWLSPDGEDSRVADMVYYGLPAAVGISIQGSASSVFADPVRDASGLMSSVTVRHAMALSDAIGGAVETGMWTGQAPQERERVRDALVRAFAPRSIQRLVQGAEGDYIRSLNTGNPNVMMTPQERLLYTMGVNPVAVDKAYAAQSELWRDQSRMRRAVQEFGRAVAEAQQGEDWDEVNQLVRRAMARGIPLDSVWRSAASRRDKDQTGVLGRQFREEDVLAFESVLGDPGRFIQ
jgi:hypothetical protein